MPGNRPAPPNHRAGHGWRSGCDRLGPLCWPNLYRAGDATRSGSRRRSRSLLSIFGFTAEKGGGRGEGGNRAARPSQWRRAPMQLGMIGFGRMGGNMVQRLIRAGHIDQFVG
jgi:hypothetical protein